MPKYIILQRLGLFWIEQRGVAFAAVADIQRVLQSLAVRTGAELVAREVGRVYMAEPLPNQRLQHYYA